MIDWDRLNELRRDIGEDDFLEVAKLFVEELSEVMDRLAIAPATATQNDFHFLRGSAANLGFVEFASRCAAAEEALGKGQFIDFKALCEIYTESLAEAAGVLPTASQAA